MDADRLAQHVATGPSGEVAAKLLRLVDAERAAEAKIAQLDDDERAAAGDVARLGAELIALERRAGRGEPVTNKERTVIESALTAARARVGELWPERRSALRAVRRDRAEETRRLVSANFSALLDEMEPDCVRAAQRVDAAAQEVVDAAADRDQCHQRVEAVAQIVLGQTAYGDIIPAASAALASVAERFIAQGGERVPLLRDGLRPRVDVAAEQIESAVA